MQRPDRPVDEACLFCRIIAGAVPCARVYEDDAVLAFLDINPVRPGHTLVVLKGHYPTLLDVPLEEAEGLFAALKTVAAALRAELRAGGFHCLQNNFSVAGQTVFHAHWHLIPRAAQDGLELWTGRPYKDEAQMRQLAEALASRAASGFSGGTHER
ncbi:MAG: HIT domain-containing protein [Deltaproteobacteria bacterium]|jgi:histidine triad (HIT) family protein|nr:HIT domain-containing protein [Deltaproteobacteria bacterium]